MSESGPGAGGDAFAEEVTGRFGVLPNIFRSAGAAPGLMEELWAFARVAYLDSPIPSLFKERLFVHLSRFCEARYCVVRHVGFLVGSGRPSGDVEAIPQTVEQALELLRRPLPDGAALSESLARLEAYPEPAPLPQPETQAERDLFNALTVLFLDPRRSDQARRALRRAAGAEQQEALTAFLAFVRTVHFWTEAHPELDYEPDVQELMERHPELAQLLLDPSEAHEVRAGQSTWAGRERALAEAAMRDSESRFRTLADAVPQVIWTNLADGTANYFNARWYEYTGLMYEQSVGLGWQALVHPEDEPASVERWYQALAAGEVFDTEYRLRGRHGEYRWFLGRNVPLRDARGQVTGWFGSATDIEDLKRAQAAQRESDERFRLLVEGARDYAMFLLSPEGHVTFWSTGAERLFGYTEAEARGHHSGFVFTPEDRERGEPEKEIRTALREGRAMDRRWHVRKDGSRFWADGILMRLNDDGGHLRGFAKVARDATEQRRSEEALHEALEQVAQANALLEQRVEERTQELARMGELRQQLLRRLVHAQEEERGRISRDLHDDTGQQVTALLLGLGRLASSPAVTADPAALDTIRQLQSVADEVAQKSHGLAVTLRPTVLDDLGLVPALNQYVEEWTRWSGVRVELESVGLEERLPLEMEITVYRIAQEALTNVLRHAASRAEHQATRVSILLQRRGDQVLVMIEDDGPGFDVDAELRTPPGQRRLGIFGMQARAQLAGGALNIESELGKGTTLYLRLPVTQQDGANG